MTMLALHVFAFTLLAQPSSATTSAPIDMYRLGREVTLLSQLAPLRLTEKQVKGILALYREAGRLAASDAVIVDQLQQIRQRLLAGEPIAVKDIQAVLNALPQDVRRGGGGGGRGGPAPNEMVDKAIALLEEWQQAILANRTDTLQVIMARRGGAPVADASRVFLAIAAVPKEQWATQRTRLADRVAAAIVDEKQRKQIRDALLDFLDRIHGMNEVQVRTQADELWQNIVALFPPDLPVLSLLSDVDLANLRRRAAPLFMDPMTPALLQQMATARGWHVN